MIKNTHSLIDFIFNNINNVNIAVDMTAGNGNDSLKIINKFSPEILYCFDIQNIAKKNTLSLIESSDTQTKIKFIVDNHANIDKYINTKIDLAIYNLGYLPGYSHEICTDYLSVIESLKYLLEIISINGTICLTLYPGHDSGYKEKIEIEKFLSNISQTKFTIIKSEFINQINNPPYIIVIKKISE